MKARLLCVFACVVLLTIPALAGEVYNDGPINGNTDAWTINFGFVVSDSFTVSTGNTPVTGLTFGAWLIPGDVLQSVEVSISSQPLGGGTMYFDQVVNFTASGCQMNSLGLNVCTETGSFEGPTLANGTYWLNLQNAIATNGDPVYWDENSGVGCTSPGCPSQAYNNADATNGPPTELPPESFALTNNTTGTTPEPGSIVLLGTGVAAIAGISRRRLSR